MSRNLRGRLERLEQQAAMPVGNQPPDLWSWIEAEYAHRPHPAADECRAWWLANLPPGFVPHRLRTVNPVEERIQAILNERLANERPPLPIGLCELPKEDRHGP
jgi:hypothetical protein